MSSDQAIAEVIADLRAGRVTHMVDNQKVNAEALRRARIDQPVVDITAIYQDIHHRIIDKGEQIYVYEDHPCITPPWENALFTYVNRHGNVIVLQTNTEPFQVDPFGIKDGRWDTPNEVNWNQVRWLAQTLVWVGGRSNGTVIPLGGPMHMLWYAIYDSGEPADMRWFRLMHNLPMDLWDISQLALLASLNFLNCKNVNIVEPERPRPQRRRMARTGVTVQHIVVRPVGRRTQSVSVGAGYGTTPITDVRGHFARYGPEHDRKLLFGKYAGRFWIPQHARGRGERDGDRKSYVLRPAAASPEDRTTAALGQVATRVPRKTAGDVNPDAVASMMGGDAAGWPAR